MGAVARHAWRTLLPWRATRNAAPNAWRALLVTSATLFCAPSAQAAAKPLVFGFLLPTQRGDAAALTARLAALTRATAQRIGGREAEFPPAAPELLARLKRARAMALSGSLDEAAALFDTALEEGARSLDRLGGASEDLISGHMRRAVIALARGERDRLAEIVARALRWDGALNVLPREASPQLRAALAEIRARNGDAPPLSPSDIEGACQRVADVLLVGRARPNGGLQVMRFDDCRAVVEVTLESDGDTVQALTVLSAPTARIRASLHVGESAAQVSSTIDKPSAQSPKRRRAERIAGPISLAVGLGLTATGIYFGVRSASERSDLNRGCDPSMPCGADVLETRGRAIQTSDTLAGVLSSMGAAALIAGAVVTYFGTRQQRSHRSSEARSSRIALSPFTPSGAALLW